MNKQNYVVLEGGYPEKIYIHKKHFKNLIFVIGNECDEKKLELYMINGQRLWTQQSCVDSYEQNLKKIEQVIDEVS